jgi:hypothetical protein
MSVSLYPHQREAVKNLSNGKILWGGVGTGKSITAAAYYVQKEAPRDVYVITTAKKRDSFDWEKEFLKFGVGDIRTPTTGRLMVDSWNNIAKYKNVRGAFFIFDEQRLVGSGAWAKAFQFIAKEQNKNRWILLSATPGDTWMDYIPVFIANGFYKNRTEFIRDHVVYSSYTKFPKIEKYINTVKLQRLRNSLLVHMPYERHTTRVTQEIEVEYDQEMLDKVIKDRWNPYTDMPIKSLAEFFYTMRKVVYSHPSRLEKVREKLVKHPKLIVFYNFDYELTALRTLAEPKCRVLNAKEVGKHPPNSVYVGRPSKWGNPFAIGKDGTREEVVAKYREYILGSKLMDDLHELRGKDLVCWCSPESCHADVLAELVNKDVITVAEWNGHKHEEIPKTDQWVYLVQYTSGSEGWNCIETNATLFYSLTYSYRVFHQAHGRIDRLNTSFTTLRYYVLMADVAIEHAVKKALVNKHSFNEVKFVKKFKQITLTA